MGRKYKKYAKNYNPFKKEADVDLAIKIVKSFKRIFKAISHLERLGIGPKDVPTDVCIIVQQMVQDMEYTTKNIMDLMKNKNLPDRDRSIRATYELIEKFEVIIEETERFVFSIYGRP